MAPPSEFDLRAALREGEGDEPNVSHLIMAAEARRAQRRTRLLSTAVVVGVVGALAAGAVELGGGSSGSDTAASAQRAGGESSNGDVLHGVAGAAPVPGVQRALASISCPSAAPDYQVDSSGSALNSPPDQLFSRRVTSVVVCAYGPTFYATSSPGREPARLELAGRLATRFATSLERADTTAPNSKCSVVSTDQFAVIPVDASGNQLPAIAAQLPGSACGAVVTNGSVVRYDWRPPPKVAQKLQKLTPTAPVASSVVASPTPSSTG